MSTINKIMQKLIICFLMILFAHVKVQAQTTQPTWWFGASGAANFNFYDGTTQRLNNSLIVPRAFHKGNGVRPYGSFLMEYRPGRVWGAMLNVGYDGRGAKMDTVIAPCNCPATLKTDISYITVEPSLRIGLKSSSLYFFAGPRVAFGLSKSFAYTQFKQPNSSGDLSAMHSTIFSGQVGAGYDFTLSSPTSITKVSLSPFISYHPYFGQEPRSIESLSLTTVRAGVALKFGKTRKTQVAMIPPLPLVPVFTLRVRAPLTILAKRQVSEILPLLNAVFFDEGSTNIPNRYVMLTHNQAAGFKEMQLQKEQSADMNGRTASQLNVYHNILNILGDRMRSNPGISISLSGSSARGLGEGKAFAESVKQYLITVFGIEGSRMITQSRNKPFFPSEQPGGTKDLDLLRQEDRRVDISSTSPALLMEVGGGMIKPVQITTSPVDSLDSRVVFNVGGAEQLKSWTIDATDKKGDTQHYGPFNGSQASVPGVTVLGARDEEDFKVVMLGQTQNGLSVRNEGAVHLVRPAEIIEKGFRYSIMFDFNQSTTVESYHNFLTNVVSPLISDGSLVVIHGHTDIIGGAEYNQSLSASRAQQAQHIIEHALVAANKKQVKFDTQGFGKDISHSPFENNLPEERFYNRTVIIDITPVK